MVAKVRHLVTILDEVTLIPISGNPNEQADLKLAQELLVPAPGVAWQRYQKKEMVKPTPDFKIFKDGTLAGFCEVKAPDTPQTRGMVAKVRHLVTILDEVTLIPISGNPNEQADLKLAQELLVPAPGVAWQRYQKKEMVKPTPDFKIFKDGTLAGFCEVKSPRDDWTFEFPKAEPG